MQRSLQRRRNRLRYRRLLRHLRLRKDIFTSLNQPTCLGDDSDLYDSLGRESVCVIDRPPWYDVVIQEPPDYAPTECLRHRPND